MYLRSTFLFTGLIYLTESSPTASPPGGFVNCGEGSVSLTNYCWYNGAQGCSTSSGLVLEGAPGICATCKCSKQRPTNAGDGGLESWLEYLEGHPGSKNVERPDSVRKCGVTIWDWLRMSFIF